MQKIIYFLIFITSLQTASAQNKTVVAMKSQVYDLVEEISKKGALNLQFYKEQMVSLDLLKKAAESPDLLMSAKHREVLEALTKAQYAQVLLEDHQAIIKEAKAQNINWKKIKFSDYLLKSRASFKLGQPGYEGLLILEDTSQPGKRFTLKVDFLMLGTQPYIFEMNNFQVLKTNSKRKF